MEQLRKILKSARTYAQRGEFRESIDLFDEVLDSIQQHLTLHHVNDRKAIDDWHNFQYHVETEKSRVQNIQYNHAFEQRRKYIKDVESTEVQKTKYDNFQDVKPARNHSQARPKKDLGTWDPPSPKLAKRPETKFIIPSGKPIPKTRDQK
jgi:hypothetical protein